MRWYFMGPYDFCDLELDIGLVQVVPGLSPHELPQDIPLFFCGDRITDTNNLLHPLIVQFKQEHKRPIFNEMVITKPKSCRWFQNAPFCQPNLVQALHIRNNPFSRPSL